MSSSKPTPEELRDEYDVASMSRNAFPPDKWVYDEWAGEWYAPFDRVGETGHHILRGSCDETVEDEDGDGEHTCGFRASVRRITPDMTVEEYCRIHAPESWMAALEDRCHVDDTLIDLRSSCKAWVTDVGPSRGRPEPLSDDESPGGRSFHRCGDQAFVLLTNGDDYARPCCRKHAREGWFEPLRRPTGFPTRPAEDHPDKVVDMEPDDSWEYVHAPSGTVYPTYLKWQEAMNGAYSDVMMAEEDLVVLKDNGVPVRDA